MHQTYQICRTR